MIVAAIADEKALSGTSANLGPADAGGGGVREFRRLTPVVAPRRQASYRVTSYGAAQRGRVVRKTAGVPVRTEIPTGS